MVRTRSMKTKLEAESTKCDGTKVRQKGNKVQKNPIKAKEMPSKIDKTNEMPSQNNEAKPIEDLMKMCRPLTIRLQKSKEIAEIHAKNSKFCYIVFEIDFIRI